MLTFSALSLLGVLSANALHIPLHRRADLPHGTSVRLTPTANVTGDDPFGFESVGGNAYAGTIFVADQPFLVQLDTGSADLWLDTHDRTLTGLTDTGIQSGVSYVDGTSAEGNINIGNVTWGDFTVLTQAFINAPDATATSNGEFQGLLGIGPPAESQIFEALNSTQYNGNTFLDNVFSLYPNESNFITFLLNRSAVGTIDGGIFSIGEVAPGYEGIANATQLDVLAPSAWITYMDAVVVNGEPFSGGSMGSPFVPNIPSDKVVVVLDTGTSLSTAPQQYVDEIFGKLPGALYNGDGSYTVDCGTKLNISMQFGSTLFPLNPIDITSPYQIYDNGTITCIGFLTYTSANAGTDFLLGDSFLRNVYSLFDYGTWAGVGTTPPFMKILSVTDADQAWADFDSLNAARLAAILQAYGPQAGASPTATDPSATATDGAAAAVVTVTSTVTSTPAHAGAGDKDVSGAVADSGSGVDDADIHTLLRNSWIIIGVLGGILVLLVLLVAKSFSGHAAKKAKGYKSIQDPTSFPPAHDKPYNPQYSDYSTPYADGGH